MNFFDATIESQNTSTRNTDGNFIIDNDINTSQRKETELKYVTVYELNCLLDKHIERFSLNKAKEGEHKRRTTQIADRHHRGRY